MRSQFLRFLRFKHLLDNLLVDVLQHLNLFLQLFFFDFLFFQLRSQDVHLLSVHLLRIAHILAAAVHGLTPGMLGDIGLVVGNEVVQVLMVAGLDLAADGRHDANGLRRVRYYLTVIALQRALIPLLWRNRFETKQKLVNLTENTPVLSNK